MYGHTILVTGAGRGIGRAIALEIAKPKDRLILTWNHDQGSAEETANILSSRGIKSELHQLNLQDKKSLYNLIKSFSNGKTPDIVINNAALAQKKDFLDISIDDWDMVLAANLRAPFQLSQAVIPTMKSRGWGRIINISSIGGQWGGVHQVHYAASKAALINLTRSLSKLYSPYGISCMAIAPGIIDTDMTMKSLGHNQGELLSQIPCGRLGKVDDIANAVKYLCSDDANYLSGITLNINGGMLFSS
jgi:NAD(P)-dependent dehydrogenase (short-subunit alcohol dehydrogenase family)